MRTVFQKRSPVSPQGNSEKNQVQAVEIQTLGGADAEMTKNYVVKHGTIMDRGSSCNCKARVPPVPHGPNVCWNCDRIYDDFAKSEKE
jgi:hypothetical protein